MKTLIEIHILQNFAPSNLNRDDTGAPKDAIFGGTRRARVSSQCIKHSVRQFFKSLIGQGILSPDDVAARTKRIVETITKELLLKRNSTREEAEEKVRLALKSVELTVDEDKKSQYLLFVGKREIQGIVQIIDNKWESITQPKPSDENRKGGKNKKETTKNADPDLKKALIDMFNGGKAVDVALFGRMLADMPKGNQYAACQVAHAISTHAVDREFDFFTAVDDLKPEDTAGADMMGTVEFNSACFYRYAVLDWETLLGNLGGDVDLSKKGLRAFLEGFIVAEPTGKQNTFAAHNPPEFVAVSIRQNAAPMSLANAFEIPVHVKKFESLTKESAVKLIEKSKTLQAVYGKGGKTFVLNPVQADVSGFGVPVTTIKELLDKTENELKV